jgi:hypothetical protein
LLFIVKTGKLKSSVCINPHEFEWIINPEEI